ncbi:MAG: acyltransferase [Bacteroidota bacterium]
MTPSNPAFALIVFLIAFLTAYLIKAKYSINYSSGRYECIDGLRGFLALSVFIHHSNIWYTFLQTGVWDAPQSNLYNQFGQTSVSLFFMITSFLFISKLLNTETKRFDWIYFFVSRMNRLVPMYYFSLYIIIVIVMIISQWSINDELINYFTSIMHWSLFTIVQSPVINNSGFTHYINAGVVWSLPYEWLFYFSLPLVSILLLRTFPPVKYIVLSVIFIAVFYNFHGIVRYPVYSFIGGAIAPFLLKFTSLNKYVKGIYGSAIVIICLFLIGSFHTANDTLCILLIAVVFTTIALGNSMFGLLKNSTLKLLGEICYSTYLLHGIVLFILFYFGFGLDKIKLLSPLEYNLVIFLTTPVLVFVSFLGFRYIEKPFMDKSKKLTAKIKIKTRLNLS